MITETLKAPQGISVVLQAPSTPLGKTSRKVGLHQGTADRAESHYSPSRVCTTGRVTV